MLVLDEQGLILLFNKASEILFGQPAARVVGAHVKSLMPPDIADKHGSGFADYFRGAETTGDVRLQGSDGKDLPVEVSFSAVSDAAGARYLLVVRELREGRAKERLLDLQANLVHSARMSAMDDMSAALTHKLNQPLTAVILYLQTIERVYGRETDGGQLPDRVVSILEKAVREAERASNVLQRMRQFLEQRETMPRLIDLNQTLEDAIELTAPAGRPGMHVARLLTPRLPPVLVDPGQLQQVLVDLIRGAMDWAKARDHAGIRVATHHFGDHVAVVVEANGAVHHGEAANGIPVALDEEHVNGRDFAISRAIAQDHGGDLVVDSGERERGTRFTLRLPVPARVSAPPA